jgi:CII-binding regulator of phage lambda lysogenization HflD
MIQKDMTLSVGNIIWIVGIIFTMGIAYSQIAQLDEDIIVLEKRLEKKIKLLNECEDRIVEIEKELARMGTCKHIKK